jgi:uncharacterized membrane protein
VAPAVGHAVVPSQNQEEQNAVGSWDKLIDGMRYFKNFSDFDERKIKNNSNKSNKIKRQKHYLLINLIQMHPPCLPVNAISLTMGMVFLWALPTMNVVNLLPWQDWLALVCFFGLWIGYAWFAKFWGHRQRSLLLTTNMYRTRWMIQTTSRDPRMLDGIITQNLSHTPSFFSSTTLLIIGGLMAALSTTDKAAELVKDMPFAQATSIQVLELKMLLLLAIFTYAFFRFTWCMRQYTFLALVIGAMPHQKHFEDHPEERDPWVQRAANLVGLAAETFNDGLRAYYFSFAMLAWFLSPVVMVLVTLLVVAVLYSREFRSDVLKILRD